MHQINPRLTVHHLRLIAATVAQGNLVRTTTALNMAQSAVTKALQDAEAQMGVFLFERTSLGVVPTTSGAHLAAHARLILAQFGKAEQELADLRDGSAGLLPKAIARLRQGRPNLVMRVDVRTKDVLRPAARSGELDLVPGRLPEFCGREGVRQEHLMNDYAQVVMRRDHPLFRRPDLHLSDLLDQDWILPGPSTTLRRQIDMPFRDENLEPPLHAVKTVSLLTARRLLQLTNYLAVWPVQLARLEIQGGTIAALQVPLPTTVRLVGISARADDLMSPAEARPVCCLHDVANELSAASAMQAR